MAGLDAALAGVTRWVGTNLLIDTVRITLPGEGEPVLNTETGQLEYPEDELLYEGPGAIIPRSATADVSAISDAGQPWYQETKSSGMLLTPLDAAIAPQYAIVTVIGVHDSARAGLIGRTWITPDAGLASTVEVVRRTPIDQKRVPEGGTP